MRRLRSSQTLRERLESELAAAADLDAEVAACETERAELAKREAAGDSMATSPADLAKIDQREAQARAAAAHHRRVALNLQSAVEAEERRQELRRFDQAAGELDKLHEAVCARARRVTSKAEAFAEEVRGLEADRAAVTAAEKRLREIQPADVELPEVAFENPDRVEVDSHLIRFLEDERRHADGAAHARAAADNAERQKRQAVKFAVEEVLATPKSMIRNGTVSSAIERLPEDLREQARDELERRRAELRGQRLAV